jgi:transposase
MSAKAQKAGDLRTVKRISAIIMVAEGYLQKDIADVLGVSTESIRIWVKKYLTEGPEGLRAQKSSGRKPRLTKTQKKELGKIIEDGPQKAGFSAACWRSPMIQQLIHDKFDVFYSVYYISELLKNMGFSFQKAKFESAHLDPEARAKWEKKTWPTILKEAREKNAHIMFGDEASFPQWGSLSYTWARKGKQPVVKTSGIRKSYKVFGLIEYFTGKFFSKGYEGRLNSNSYAEFLSDVLKKTRKHIILIQDGAPYHKSKAMKDFFEKYSNRITVYRLPSYSPDYNPIEMLWKKIKQKKIHMHYFPTFSELVDKVNEALLNFQKAKQEILNLFGFYTEKPENAMV